MDEAARHDGDVAYGLPRHDTEIDRLDVHHYALRAALRGNVIAPLRAPGTILDVASGTGRWAYDVCGEFPDATVVGLDVVTGRPGRRPANYRHVQANVLRGLPFADGSFDYVHQRLMVSALPIGAWPDVVRDLVRVTRPGGWVELVESGSDIEPSGPATTRLFELAAQLAASYELDRSGSVSSVLDDHLRAAGAEAVEKRSVPIPIGDWGGRVGSLMASELRSTFMGLCATFESRFGLPAALCQELLHAMRAECEGYRSRYTFTVAIGRKP